MESSNLHVMDHPLIQHKISLLRRKETDVMEFRRLVHDVALLIGYEAARDLKLKSCSIETPLEIMEGKILARPVCLVPILRAGLGMVDALLELFPKALVGHIGLRRNEKTLQPVEYYRSLPPRLDQCDVFVLDPMLATGGSAIRTIDSLKNCGAQHIHLLNLVGAPEGVKAVLDVHPDVSVYLGTLDRSLNENGYILPGLGDAGDRLFGTL